MRRIGEMSAHIYKQTYDDKATSKNVNASERAYGFIRIPCPDCNGSGTYYTPDDIGEPCVMCKATGELFATL